MASKFSLASCVGLALLAASCSRKEVHPGVSPAASGSAVASAPAPAAAAAPLTGLDSCLVGKWKASGVTLKIDSISAHGGANVTLDVAPSGASVIDFGPMSDVRATGASLNFDFRYSGKASGTLKSPSRGILQSEAADYTGLRVTATIKLPGAGSVPLLKETPVTQLANMGVALAGAGKGSPKAKPSAAAPSSASQLGTPAKGIDSNPIFASSRYTCEGNSLSLRGGEQGFEWLFARVLP